MNEQNLKISKSSIYKICLIILALLFAFATFMPFIIKVDNSSVGFFQVLFDNILNFKSPEHPYNIMGYSLSNIIISLIAIISILTTSMISCYKNIIFLINKEEKNDTLFLSITIGLYFGFASLICLKTGGVFTSLRELKGQSYNYFYLTMSIIAITYFIVRKIEYYHLSLTNFNTKLFIKVIFETLSLCFSFILINCFVLQEFHTTSEYASSNIGAITIDMLKSENISDILFIIIIYFIPLLLSFNFVIQSLSHYRFIKIKLFSAINTIFLIFLPLIFISISFKDSDILFITSSFIYNVIICTIPLILIVLEQIFLKKINNNQ